MFDTETIRDWIASAEADISRLAQEVEHAQYRLAESRRRLMLLYEMLASVTNAPVNVSTDRVLTLRSVREQVQADAEAILLERGAPMRAQDIHAEFIRRGVPLPGRGAPTNIIAHLVASDRFSRHRRGVYGLAEWDRSASSGRPSQDSESVTRETKSKAGGPAEGEQRAGSI